MASVNKAIIIGNLGCYPEIRYTHDGKAVVNMSVATTDKWKDKTTGESKSKTEWHRVVVFERLADICGQYLVKGSGVYFEGPIRTRSWEKDGITRYTTEIHAREMQMLGEKKPGNSNHEQQPMERQSQSGGYDGYQPPPDEDIPF